MTLTLGEDLQTIRFPFLTTEQVDSLNRQLQERVEREGDAWFSYTVLNGRVALRVNVENRCMEQGDIDRLVQVICQTADRILAEQTSTGF